MSLLALASALFLHKQRFILHKAQITVTIYLLSTLLLLFTPYCSLVLSLPHQVNKPTAKCHLVSEFPIAAIKQNGKIQVSLIDCPLPWHADFNERKYFFALTRKDLLLWGASVTEKAQSSIHSFIHTGKLD